MCDFVQTLRIGISGRIGDIFDILEKGFGKDRNYKFELQLNSKANSQVDIDVDDQNTEIVFYSETQDKLSDCAIEILSKELAQYIINNYEKSIMQKAISDNYGYYSLLEQEELFEIAKRKLYTGESSIYTVRTRISLIEKKLIDYLSSYEYIQIDGFVKFRLKEYMFRLEEYIEEAADEFVAKREYDEFIKLLRHFVDVQQPKYNKIHLVIDESGFYNILDEGKNDLTSECTQSFLSELEEGANFDDVLMSYLIMMAPRIIILHGHEHFRNKELLETIKNVFPARLIICTNCDSCVNIQ